MKKYMFAALCVILAVLLSSCALLDYFEAVLEKLRKKG